MGTEQKQIQKQLTELQGKVKDIDENQQKLLQSSKADDEASETGEGASKKADDEAPNAADENLRTEDESSAERNAELWVKELKDKVGDKTYEKCGSDDNGDDD